MSSVVMKQILQRFLLSWCSLSFLFSQEMENFNSVILSVFSLKMISWQWKHFCLAIHPEDILSTILQNRFIFSVLYLKCKYVIFYINTVSFINLYLLWGFWIRLLFAYKCPMTPFLNWIFYLLTFPNETSFMNYFYSFCQK